MTNRALLTLITSTVAVLSGCSATQIQTLSQIKDPLNSHIRYQLDNNVTVKASKTADTLLREGTIWQEVGRLDEGVVYRTKDQVVIVNSFNVHEGYIVIQGHQVAGYYLPIEKTFVQSQPADISLTKMESSDEN